MKRLLMVAAAAFLTFLPMSGFAEYVIRLNSGRQFITDRYWEEEGEIHFKYAGGTLGFSRELIASIEERGQAVSGEQPDAKPEAAKPDRSSPPVTASHAEKKEKKGVGTALQDLIDKKRSLKKQLDEALARLREASKNQDEAAKKKAREEMRDYSRQIDALTEQAKALNNGRLPDGWWQD